MVTMAENGSMKIVHPMALRSRSNNAIPAFLSHLPEALVRTFNKHPRMRAKQVRGEFATAEIQPPITIATVWEDSLLEIRAVSEDDKGSAANWETYAEVECNRPFDRYSELPFYVRVWHYPADHLVRVMLFSDHYMSDGISGLTVLNDLVSVASQLSREGAATSEILPLRPSLYEMWMHPHPIQLFFSKALVKFFGRKIYKDELKRFTPVIPLRADQVDFKIPAHINTSSMLFGQGTPANMEKALQRCKEEGVTLFGALAAAVVVAFYIASEKEQHSSGGSGADSRFKLLLDLPFNMRKRVSSPPEETPVGAYMVANALESIHKEGVDMDNARFWDTARKSKQEVDAMLKSFLMPLPVLFLDKFVNSNLTQEFLRDVSIPHSIASDCDISNVGKYPFKTTHEFKAATSPASGDELEQLTIESVHVCNSIPHLGPAANVYITSTDMICYAMMHKYESQQGEKLFAAFMASVEHIGFVGGDDTMAEVVSAVQQTMEKSRALSPRLQMHPSG